MQSEGHVLVEKTHCGRCEGIFRVFRLNEETCLGK